MRIDIDKWEEIFKSIRKHKLRTGLTALGVFWGIFMLVLLLGAGTGLENGVKFQFRDDAVNSIWIWPGTTSIPYKGLPKGRDLSFDNDDFQYLIDNFEDIEYITGRFYLGGNRNVVYKDKNFAYPIRSVHPDHKYLENTQVVNGRYINESDIDEFRKVAVIGKV
ncbi:MAG: ABC transporter permease, partial [Bacteroidota bacterium]